MSVAPDTDPAPAAFRPSASAGGRRVERTVTTTDGVRLSVTDYGSDRAEAPTVVLLHGLLLSQESWELQVCQLRRRYGSRIRIITYDHRGHGRAPRAIPAATPRTSDLTTQSSMAILRLARSTSDHETAPAR